MKHLTNLLFLVAVNVIFSQKISGYVYSSSNGKPLEGASVYFDGSTIGTITDAEGYFELLLKYRTRAKLVISYVGYEPQIIDSPYGDEAYNVKLNAKVENLKEVVVSTDPFSRKQKLQVFRDEFLGETRAGRNCAILNEHVLRLRYDTNGNVLYATAEEPLIISNDYLGYRIIFTLNEFEVDFRKRSLDRLDNIQHTLFAGTSFFEDIAKGDPEKETRRLKTYLGSPLHFMRTTVTKSWKEEGFVINNNRFKKISPEDYIEISIENDLFKIFLKEKIRINYRRRNSSIELLEGNDFYIDGYGYHVPGTNVLFGGYMSELRLGDLLPMDIEFVREFN